METLCTIEAWQIDVGDLIQFEAYDEDRRYIELMRVDRVQDVKNGDEDDYVLVHGESLDEGDSVTHELDPFLEVEVMGA